MSSNNEFQRAKMIPLFLLLDETFLVIRTSLFELCQYGIWSCVSRIKPVHDVVVG